MDGFMKEPLAPALEELAVARVLFDVRDQAGIEDQLPRVRGSTAAIEVDIGASEIQADLLATCFKAFKPFGNSTIAVSLTGATGRGASTEPWLSVMALTFSPFWCL
jgi:hypothetical protein